MPMILFPLLDIVMPGPADNVRVPALDPPGTEIALTAAPLAATPVMETVMALAPVVADRVMLFPATMFKERPVPLTLCPAALMVWVPAAPPPPAAPLIVMLCPFWLRVMLFPPARRTVPDEMSAGAPAVFPPMETFIPEALPKRVPTSTQVFTDMTNCSWYRIPVLVSTYKSPVVAPPTDPKVGTPASVNI